MQAVYYLILFLMNHQNIAILLQFHSIIVRMIQGDKFVRIMLELEDAYRPKNYWELNWLNVVKIIIMLNIKLMKGNNLKRIGHER